MSIFAPSIKEKSSSWSLSSHSVVNESFGPIPVVFEPPQKQATHYDLFPRKSELGQFMTPLSISRFMVSLFPNDQLSACRLLDPGAGEGALSSAFIDKWSNGGFNFTELDVCAVEIDEILRARLQNTFSGFPSKQGLSTKIIKQDFIECAQELIQQEKKPFTHAILNPPYKKINSHSQHRLALRQVGIETVNLYSAFLSLSLNLIEPGGYLVAIIPRSFCNGPYYKTFRNHILGCSAIRHIHLFSSRKEAFRDDKVLQENIVILLQKEGEQGPITISNSTDDTFSDLISHEYPFDRIVFPDDQERFIHVPTDPSYSFFEQSSAIQYSLEDIGVKVSTGPVVDFRLKDHLRNMPETGTVPLIYPSHFTDQNIEWPMAAFKKSNAILRNPETERWLYPTGYYCVVRRFSSKEEKRRLVANTVQPENFTDAKMLGFENHLNVFHIDKSGLPEDLALGLSVFLNATDVDKQFRRFNGHTQVNATDLKLMKYPSKQALKSLGKWAKQQGKLTQQMIDKKIGKISQL